ncbi:leucyl aminopeptidase [Paenibacillus naphthalenovorans]|uniref:leucyl aminopeptidase n=1 Tax=Paenibacillus naphthalenovorans TaxID=162209 RepID=UPI0009F6A2E3|nr:leucyl aminopeptidase [Paenibacillus naphthalenovorans]
MNEVEPLDRLVTQELSMKIRPVWDEPREDNEAEEDASQALAVFITREKLESGAWTAAAGTEVPAAIVGAVRELAARGRFSGRLGETEALPTLGLMPGYQALLLCGLGEAARAEGTDAWRDAGVYAARAALGQGLERLAAPLPRAGRAAVRELVYALAEGLWLGCYRMPSFAASRGTRPPALKEVALLCGRATADERAGLQRSLEAAYAMALATHYARDLTNLPGNYLVPETLAREAQTLAARYGLECTVLDEHGIREQGMGGLAAVGGGSANPPRMIAIRYRGTEEENADVIGLVGKGITFDTGGISLKKPEGMEEMISDMGGAAVLLGLIHVLGRLRPQVHAVIVIPAAENMPSGSAFKPGDVISVMNGQTVEILNTDAEGRVVLADGVLYAKALGATRLIDVATLTGAVLVSFADVATGAVSNDEPFLQELLSYARQAGEKVWPFPNYPEYHDMLKSRVADIKNAASRDRWAGSITAGLFIGFFAGDAPWVHLDTGGTAWLWNERGTEPQGGTGAMVRTLGHYLCGSPAAEGDI